MTGTTEAAATTESAQVPAAVPRLRATFSGNEL